MKGCLTSELTSYANTMTKVAQSNKLSFACYKNNEVFKGLNRLEIDPNEKSDDDAFLTDLLLGFNTLN